MTSRAVIPARNAAGRWRYALVALVLFVVWSNSFVAASFLLGGEGAAAQLDWVSLSVARFIPATPLCLAWCLIFARRESLLALRRYPLRLAGAGLMSVPCYNLALYYGQEHGVPPPVASLTTALLPLFVMILAATVLGERLTGRAVAGFFVAVSGLAIIALSKGDAGAVGAYGGVLAVTALAPLSWSIYSILTKPVAGDVPPLVWTYLTICVGSVPFALVAPWRGWPELASLTAGGWGALLYLSILCTVAGYAVWTWLLRHLPASTTGFAVFLNPPLTTVSKLALAGLFPATFIWRTEPLEWLGGALSLAGLALAVWKRPSD